MNELEKLQQELEEVKTKLEASSKINSELKDEKKAALEKAASYKVDLQKYKDDEETRAAAEKEAKAKAELEAEIQKRVKEELAKSDNPTSEEDDPTPSPKPDEQEKGSLSDTQKRLLQHGLNI